MLIMRNSANNYLTKQALQTKATQLLPILTAAFLDLHYKEITHQRISHQDTSYQDIGFQGLTKARHSQFGQVMIKWEISANIYYDLTHLGHEIKVLQALNGSQCKTQPTINIAPQVLIDKSSMIKILNKNYQLSFLVMPYYPLGSLAQYLKQALSIEQKHQLITQAAYLISHLHKQGWLHNDIKPSNFLISTFLSDIELANKSATITLTHSLLLTDFALAQRINSVKNENNQPAGTPAYLAPECWQGKRPTQQSDSYAFGIMVYEILTGDRPFKRAKISDEPFNDWAIQHCQQSIPKLPIQYQDYQLIIDKSLAKKAENRYKDMTEVIADLYQCSDYKPLSFKG